MPDAQTCGQLVREPLVIGLARVLRRQFREDLPELAPPKSHDAIRILLRHRPHEPPCMAVAARGAAGGPDHADSRWFEQPVHPSAQQASATATRSIKQSSLMLLKTRDATEYGYEVKSAKLTIMPPWSKFNLTEPTLSITIVK